MYIVRTTKYALCFMYKGIITGINTLIDNHK